MRKTLLVTGGLGFVGRTLVSKLHRDFNVVIADNADGDIRRRIPAASDDIKLERLDIRDLAAVTKLMDTYKPDAIIHLAAVHFIPLCESDPQLAVSTNVGGTVNLLATAPEGCRFVFASSAAVYAPADELHDEQTSRIGPLDIYGFTKLQGEDYARYFARQRQLQMVIVRLFNVAGPGETNPHLLPDLLVQVMSGKRELSLGNLYPKRDYVHVEDVARGFAAAALDGTVQPGETVTVNLGTSEQHSVSDVVALLSRVSGAPLIVQQDAQRRRESDRPFLGANRRRIEELFGWTPEHDLERALADLWKSPEFSPALLRHYGMEDTH